MPNKLTPFVKGQQRERRLVSEWINARHPNSRSWTQVDVGPIEDIRSRPDLNSLQHRALSRFRRTVDAVVELEHTILVVEASIPPDPGHVSQLMLYLRLIANTDHAEWSTGKPFQGVYVMAIEDVTVTTLARELGLLVDIFSPQWAIDYLHQREELKRRR